MKDHRRLDDPEDYVRIEIRTALTRPKVIPVVPVLIGRASMPPMAELPDDLKKLGRHDAAQVRPESRLPFSCGKAGTRHQRGYLSAPTRTVPTLRTDQPEGRRPWSVPEAWSLGILTWPMSKKRRWLVCSGARWRCRWD